MKAPTITLAESIFLHLFLFLYFYLANMFLSASLYVMYMLLYDASPIDLSNFNSTCKKRTVRKCSFLESLQILQKTEWHAVCIPVGIPVSDVYDAV